MRKIFLSFAFLFFLLFLLIFTSNKTYAACSQPLTIDQPILAPAFNGTITITSNTDPCFGNVEYTVTAYPSDPSHIKPGDKTPFFNAWRTDEKTISGNLNLTTFELGARYIQGKDAPGSWIVLVCQKTRSLQDCKVNLLGTTSFTVSSIPTPTPTPVPSDLVRIAPHPNQCKYQTGSELTVLLVEYVKPDTRYSWWWQDDPFYQPRRYAGKSNPSGDLSFTIPSSETSSVGRKVLCVDIEGSSRNCRPGERNTIPLEFTAASPTGDIFCTPTSAGGVGLPAPTYPQGTPYQPDCTPDPKDPKNYICQTAIGPINTSPGELVAQLLRLILGLSGGIALLLIIFSGYRMATSAGNPEALQGARETLTSAMVGLVFIILAIVILRVIGVEILRIPGFDS